MSSTMHDDRVYGGEPTTRLTTGHGRGHWQGAWAGETKGSGKTPELLALILGVLAIAICAAVFEGVDAWRALMLITGLTGAYILSRGIAKSGSAHREHDSRGGRDDGR